MSPFLRHHRPTAPALAVTLLFLATALAGCTSTAPGQLQEWDSERAVHGRVGLEATLDAMAGPAGATLTGTAQGTLDTPLTLHPKSRGFDRPAAVYFDATLPAIGAGILMLQGRHLNVTQGTFHTAPISSIDAERTLWAALKPAFGERADTSAFPRGFENQSSDYFVADHIPVAIDDWQVTGHDRALWFSGGVAEELSGRFTFDATRMHWHADSRVETETLRASFDRFAWATDAPTGTLTADTLGAMPAPHGVFGQDAEFRLTGREIDSTRPFRLTQAVTPDGFLLDAKVNLNADDTQTTVEMGSEAWARVHYREHSYIGAAVFDNISVTGPGADLIQVPLDRPPLHVQVLWDTLGDHPWFAQPFAALAFVALSPALILVDMIEGLACLFSTCPQDHPYPVWMEPGELGSFYYRVSGDAAEGTYPVTVTMHGANHAPSSFEATVVVTAPET